MNKRITRQFKSLRCEVYVTKEIDVRGEMMEFETTVDFKEFNFFKGLLGFEPTDKTYDKANKWADNVIELHKRNTQ